jgi:hypothetical protein
VVLVVKKRIKSVVYIKRVLKKWGRAGKGMIWAGCWRLLKMEEAWLSFKILLFCRRRRVNEELYRFFIYSFIR